MSMLNGMNAKTLVHVVPTPGNFPKRGGVREHIRQLYCQFGRHPRVGVSMSIPNADVIHVESSYLASNNYDADVYVCHGGFEPPPTILAVKENLQQCKVIVSVAQWIVDKYFPEYADKTIVIPNGVNLAEWEDIPESGIQPGYILYAKEWSYYMDDFIKLAELMPKQRFVSTVWPEGIKQLENVEVIGVQTRTVIRSVLNDAAALMLSGPEVCPTMLLEAWACKTPVMAKWVAGCKELMLNPDEDADGPYGGAGYEDADDPGFEYGAYVVLNYDGLGEQGYEQVVEKYQWEDLFEQYVRLYEAIKYHELARFLTTTREGSEEKIS